MSSCFEGNWASLFFYRLVEAKVEHKRHRKEGEIGEKDHVVNLVVGPKYGINVWEGHPGLGYFRVVE